MSSESTPTPAHFRGKPRPGRALSIEYRRAPVTAAREPSSQLPPDPTPALLTATTRNLGAGGAFVLCAEPLPVGTRIELRLHLPLPAHAASRHRGDASAAPATTTRPLDLTAEVRWQVTTDDDPEGAGMGVQFVDLDSADALDLSAYFSSLTGTEPV